MGTRKGVKDKGKERRGEVRKGKKRCRQVCDLFKKLACSGGGVVVRGREGQ